MRPQFCRKLGSEVQSGRADASLEAVMTDFRKIDAALAAELARVDERAEPRVTVLVRLLHSPSAAAKLRLEAAGLAVGRGRVLTGTVAIRDVPSVSDEPCVQSIRLSRRSEFLPD